MICASYVVVYIMPSSHLFSSNYHFLWCHALAEERLLTSHDTRKENMEWENKSSSNIKKIWTFFEIELFIFLIKRVHFKVRTVFNTNKLFFSGQWDPLLEFAWFRKIQNVVLLFCTYKKVLQHTSSFMMLHLAIFSNILHYIISNGNQNSTKQQTQINYTNIIVNI